MVCEQIELYQNSSNVITNPLLVVEVRSPSTEKYDRYSKFAYYKKIPPFQEYLLVEQKMPYAVASFKTAERTWQDTEAEGPESSIYLKSIECTLDLKKIYKGVKFDSK